MVLTPVQRLLLQNQAGQLRSRPGGVGFINAHGRSCPGVTTTLAKRGPAYVLRTAARMIPVRQFTVGVSHSRLVRGGKHRGSAVHHRLSHHLQCEPQRQCNCVRRGMPALPLGVTGGSLGVRKLMAAGVRFCQHLKLQTLGTEQVVATDKLATRIDWLGVDPQGGTVLTSWKTNKRANVQARAQLRLELDLLKTHGVRCSAAYIVYMRLPVEPSARAFCYVEQYSGE